MPANTTTRLGRADAALIAAEQQIAALRRKGDDLIAAGDHNDHDEITDPISDLETLICKTAPDSPIGVAVKLRQLVNDLEAATGCEGDEQSVRQIRAVVERDPFAFGGRADEVILSLFRQWIETQRATLQIGDGDDGDDEMTAANDRIDDMAREIDAMPAQGMVGLAIKSYLAIHSCRYAYKFGCDPAGLRSYKSDYGDEPGCYEVHSIAALLREAVRFVPEIEELAAPMTGDASS
jgi:hypothetical protein